jgi:hypothetical protein
MAELKGIIVEETGRGTTEYEKKLYGRNKKARKSGLWKKIFILQTYLHHSY